MMRMRVVFILASANLFLLSKSVTAGYAEGGRPSSEYAKFRTRSEEDVNATLTSSYLVVGQELFGYLYSTLYSWMVMAVFVVLPAIYFLQRGTRFHRFLGSMFGGALIHGNEEDLIIDKDMMYDQQIREAQAESMASLSEELSRLEFDMVDVVADGNCLFRSICICLHGNDEKHMELRLNCMNYMRDNSDEFEPFLESGEDFDAYCSRMIQESMWAGHLELHAVSKLLRRNLHLLQWAVLPAEEHRSRDNSVVADRLLAKDTLRGQLSSVHIRNDPEWPEIHLVYLRDEHYNAIFPRSSDAA